MIGSSLAWWAVSALAGVAAFPLAWRVFHRLPDRGWGLTRALGLLLSGYALWMGATTGLIRNDPSGAVAAMSAVLVAGLLAGRGRWGEIGRWLRANLRVLLVEEFVFALAFAGWVVVRGANPEIVATEKPMELAFLNSILRSPHFPPNDPWLSGYAISYYYFGYVLLALLTSWTGVTAGVAFNLGISLWFALTAVGTYSLTLNLLAVHDGRRRLWASLLGPAFVLLAGNATGLLEVLHSLHVFWTSGPDGTLTSGFWQALNLQYLARPPAGLPVFPPVRHWWWWQGARVINDINLTPGCPPDFPECAHVEVIDEFPFFSFLLADNHPHVLALPFVLMAVGFALQVYLGSRSAGLRLSNLRLPESWPTTLAITAIVTSVLIGLGLGASATLGGATFADALVRSLKAIFVATVGWAMIGAALALATGAWESPLTAGELIFGAWVFGALAFLNTWDFPIYLGLLLIGLAITLSRLPARTLLTLTAVGGGTIGMGSLMLYFPWLPTFASQAGGVLPNLVFPTRLDHFLVFFATSLVPLAVWLVLKIVSDTSVSEKRSVVWIGFAVPAVLLVLSWMLGLGILLAAPQEASAAAGSLGASTVGEVFRAALSRRAISSWVAILLGMMVAGSYVLARRAGQRGGSSQAGSVPFVLGLIGLGALLAVVPEFLYLKDTFGSRMNTVFKFYYAVWILWGLAAAHLAAVAWPGRRGTGWAALSLVPLAIGFIYTGSALWDKTSGFRPANGYQLDGTLHLSLDSPADYAAIQWMNGSLPTGVIAEAADQASSYTAYGRISAHTGFPAVLGWAFHEVQWRGDAEPQGSRIADLERLYLTREWEEASAILDRYGIDYVYIGPLENAKYAPVQTRKFDIHWRKVYATEEVVIYARPGVMGP